MHTLSFGKKEATWPPEGSQSNTVIKSFRLLEAVHLPAEVSVSHCKGHQKGSMEVARGNQAADQAAKRAVLQWIGVATPVPQTNLPETPSYAEGETLKAKSEGFKKIIWDGSKRRDSFFCLETSNESWLTH